MHNCIRYFREQLEVVVRNSLYVRNKRKKYFFKWISRPRVFTWIVFIRKYFEFKSNRFYWHEINNNYPSFILIRHSPTRGCPDAHLLPVGQRRFSSSRRLVPHPKLDLENDGRWKNRIPGTKESPDSGPWQGRKGQGAWQGSRVLEQSPRVAHKVRSFLLRMRTVESGNWISKRFVLIWWWWLFL